MSECYTCWRPSVYRVKTVGAEFEAVSCSPHLPALINRGLANAVPQQGMRVQVTKA